MIGKAAFGLGLLGLLGLLVRPWRGRVRRVVVEGPSMIPTLAPGDHLLVARAARLRVGDIVVLADPEAEERLLVKRVSALGPGAVTVHGDNEGASWDSRAFGAVAPSAVLGVARYRYFPAGAAGRLARGAPGHPGDGR